MKFERSEIGALFSKLRTAVPEVRAVGNDSTGILLSGPDAFATNLDLSIRAELSSPVPQGVVIPPRGVDFISGAVAPEININVTKSGLVIESGTARARLSTTPAENYPTFDGPGKDAKRCVEQALHEELKVNDIQSGSRPPKQYYSSGVDVADMIRVTGAVSAKMAAERGIKRVPLAVLSQSEVTRRMKTI